MGETQQGAVSLPLSWKAGTAGLPQTVGTDSTGHKKTGQEGTRVLKFSPHSLAMSAAHVHLGEGGTRL